MRKNLQALGGSFALFTFSFSVTLLSALYVILASLICHLTLR